MIKYCFVLAFVFAFLSGCKTNTTTPPPVGSKPDLEFYPDTVNFGTVFSGAGKNMNVIITNFGSSQVTIQSIVPKSSSSPFSVSGLPLTVSPNQQVIVSVMLSAASVGAYV